MHAHSGLVGRHMPTHQYQKCLKSCAIAKRTSLTMSNAFKVRGFIGGAAARRCISGEKLESSKGVGSG